MFHMLPNDLKLRILGNEKNLGNSQNWLVAQVSAHLPPRMKFYETAVENWAKLDVQSVRPCPILLDSCLPDILLRIADKCSKDIVAGSLKKLRQNCEKLVFHTYDRKDWRFPADIVLTNGKELSFMWCAVVSVKNHEPGFGNQKNSIIKKCKSYFPKKPFELCKSKTRLQKVKHYISNENKPYTKA